MYILARGGLDPKVLVLTRCLDLGNQQLCYFQYFWTCDSTVLLFTILWDCWIRVIEIPLRPLSDAWPARSQTALDWLHFAAKAARFEAEYDLRSSRIRVGRSTVTVLLKAHLSIRRCLLCLWRVRAILHDVMCCTTVLARGNHVGFCKPICSCLP